MITLNIYRMNNKKIIKDKCLSHLNTTAFLQVYKFFLENEIQFV